MIEAISLSKSYGSAQSSFLAVDQVSFTIRPGEIVGLLGPNGAGKTTTIRLLTGFMPPTSGRVVVAGHDMLEEGREAKRNMGYLPETPPLYPELTVEETLRFVAGLQGIPGSTRKEKIDKALEKTALVDVRKKLIGHLSKGYRQRVGIAQAIVHEPAFLILDEPTVGLDPKQILEIRELLKGFKGEHAILLSSHILQEISLVCDRVIIINRGKIVADGQINQLLMDFTGDHQRKKFLVTTAGGDRDEILTGIRAVKGVETVEEYVTDLENLFLQLTREPEA